MTDWTRDEAEDARRDAIALLRASLDGRQDDVTAILDSAGDCAARCISECLASAGASLLVRLAAALHGADATTDDADLLADAEIRAGAVRLVTAMQEAATSTG